MSSLIVLESSSLSTGVSSPSGTIIFCAILFGLLPFELVEIIFVSILGSILTSSMTVSTLIGEFSSTTTVLIS